MSAPVGRIDNVQVWTTDQLVAVVDQVTFSPSCVDFAWTWAALEILDTAGQLSGWLVHTTFRRPDRDTGKVEVGMGRQEWIAVGTTESGVVKTCWLLAELIVRHELMEAFRYRGARMFDPHKTCEQLAYPEKLG